MMHGTIELPDVSQYIAEIEAMADTIDDVAIEVINETVDFMRDQMKALLYSRIAQKDLSTGAAINAIKSEHAKRRGNIVSAKVGAIYIRGKDKDGFHLVYLEYGSPTRAATPWFRPVLDRKALIEEFQKNQLRKRGIPVT